MVFFQTGQKIAFKMTHIIAHITYVFNYVNIINNYFYLTVKIITGIS
jgi:hypothetical protein